MTGRPVDGDRLVTRTELEAALTPLFERLRLLRGRIDDLAGDVDDMDLRARPFGDHADLDSRRRPWAARPRRRRR